MEKIEVRFKIVTPMFISGADQTKAELRVPSIKGALRFWWRALNYEEDPKILLENENKIFGSSDQIIGQSKIKLSLCDEQLIKSKIERKWNVNDWKAYIGYGLSEDKPPRSGNFKEFFQPGSKFTLRCSGSDKENLEKIILPIKAFSLLGGLGSRSRKGWGSVAIDGIKGYGWNIPENIKDYIEDISHILKNNMSEIPKYSAFSKQTMIKVGQSFKDSDSSFTDIGERYKEYLKSLKPEEREGFGIPRKGVSNDRRSSPLLIHVNNIQDEYFWVCLFLKSKFTEQYETPRNGWSHVENFIDQLEGVNI